MARYRPIAEHGLIDDLHTVAPARVMPLDGIMILGARPSPGQAVKRPAGHAALIQRLGCQAGERQLAGRIIR